MIDELTLLKEMLGDLTNAGIWGVCIFVGYKLTVFTGTVASVVYIIKLVVTSIYNHLQCDFTKAQADKLAEDSKYQVDQADKARRSWQDSAAEAERERDEVKGMYKILKQKYEAENVVTTDAE